MNSVEIYITRYFLADFVVLDRDLFTTPPEEIRNVAVQMTVVGGQVVFER